MSSGICVGDLDNTLPSWVSEHLGEKSYMTDEVNQPPSSPLEESSSQAKNFDHGEDPEIATRTPLEKEFNVMTQDNLDCLRKTYSLGQDP